MRTADKLPPVDPVRDLEQRLAYRVHSFLSAHRQEDAEFSIHGLRVWMLSQTWPHTPQRASLECLAVLAWNAVCAADRDFFPEAEIRAELARQLDYLGGRSARRPESLAVVTTETQRARLYQSLLAAAEPGSRYRSDYGLPRYNTNEKIP
jgi:hypothetical protein